MSVRGLPLRTQILLALLGGAIVPLALVGVWLGATAHRSGEALLRTHLDASADRLAAAIESRWQFRTADIALIAGNDAALRAVAGGGIAAGDDAYLRELAYNVERTIPTITLHDTAGRVRWTSTPQIRNQERSGRGEPAQPAAGTVLRIESPMVRPDGKHVGVAVTTLALSGLVPADSARPGVPGTRMALRRTDSTGAILRLSPAVAFADSAKFTVADSVWLATQREIPGARLQLSMAAPLGPYVDPFTRAATVGLGALIAVALGSFALLAVLTTRATRPLRDLVAASDAITRGVMDQRVNVRGPAEVQHVSSAFNVMSENLRRTVDQLSHRSALAAVGEFATALSHDVRNALTSIKVDLGLIKQRQVVDPVARGLVERALNTTARLESAVTGALKVAREGHAPLEQVDLRDPVQAAADTVRATILASSAELAVDAAPNAVTVHGDSAALQQLFANLLFNAAQAIRPGGVVRVSLNMLAEHAVVSIADDGTGFQLNDVGAPSSERQLPRRGGTGLGLPIARKIAEAHGGELSIDSSPGQGTVVTVRLPARNGATAPMEHDVPADDRSAAASESATSVVPTH